MKRDEKRKKSLNQLIRRHLFVRIVAISVWGLVGFSHAAIAEEYQEIAIKDGGTISGKVFLKGQTPSP